MTRRAGGVRDERGAVTAELAVALPAVVVVAALAIGGVGAAARQVALQDAAADAARAVARGDAPEPFVGDVALEVAASGEVVCVTLRGSALGGVLPLAASSCADAGGR
ncbi:TadE family type IV pilus minor pilin [Agrococcus sp. SGAir0287]|uniref:TadE family type IV pilus minor pilin n=1 Tax=Agrococcus sp. SGAir0287 TaxID=2070347 RepID=UPI0010CCCFAD|nr:TadE family type IV pilus minor pilin [Agrococcus sp. SGAir0287]QCR18584.1 hypothetical protein C1N71_03235 [Agrococcus sp. SGAir0287]